MIEKVKDNRTFIMRVLVCVMTVFLVAGAFMVRGFADDDHKDDFSFYRVASAAASYYDQTHNDKKDNKIGIAKFAKDGETLSNVSNIGVAGNLVGFVDEDYSKGFFGATVSKLSASSQSRSYMSFRENEPALIAYAQYGHALQMLGLDSTANTSLDISSIVRVISGMLLILAYSLAVMVALLFKAILTMLQGLNPFAWFLGSQAIKVPFHDWFASAADKMPTALSGIQTMVSTLYASMHSISMVMIPIFFVMLVVSIILFRSGKGAMGDSVLTKIRKYVTRVVFVFVGIPILGASYTACLDSLLSGSDSDAFSVSTSAANDVIGSTLVDFEAWSINNRLALPTNVKITLSGANTVGGSIDTGGTSDLRQLARNINAMANWRLTTPTSNVSAMNGVAIDVGKASASDRTPSVLAAYDVMFRYMSSTYYKAADLETQYKSTMAGKKTSSKVTHGASLWDWFTGIVTKAPDSLMDLIENDSKVDNYGDHNKLAGSEGTGPYMTDNTSGGIKVTQNGGSFTYEGNGGKGLSTLAMYNYLTSEFTGSSVINYSNNKVAALVMSHAHRSVSAIGGGAVRVLYVLYSIIMLFVMAIIGFGYALAVLFGMFRRGVSMVMSTPFALMGNFKAMSKVTTIVAMMIIELIGTVFIYQIVIYFLTNILTIFMVPVYKIVNGGKPSMIVPVMNVIGIPAITTSSTDGQALQIGVLVLAIIVLIVFAFTAMKLRKSFVKTMDEMAASMIDRIFSPSGNEAGGAGSAYASKPTLGDKIANGTKQVAGAAGTGLAMAGANKLMQGKSPMGGLSKGDAALAGGKVEDGTAEGDELKLGNNGIEGGDQQGLPGPNDPKNPNGPNGPAMLTGAGGSLDEKAGQKLLGGQSLDDNAANGVGTNGGAVTSGGAATGEAGIVNASTAEPKADEAGKTLSETGEKGVAPIANTNGQASASTTTKLAADASGKTLSEAGNNGMDATTKIAGQTSPNTTNIAADASGKTLSEAGGKGADPMAKATGQVSAMGEERMADATKDIRKDAAAQTISGGAQAVVGAAKTYAGAQTGNTKLAAEGAHQTFAGTQKMVNGVSQGANAKQVAAQQTLAAGAPNATNGASYGTNARQAAVQQTVGGRVAPNVTQQVQQTAGGRAVSGGMQQAPLAAASMSHSQLANASQAYGSKRSGSMGVNEARTTVAAAQNVQQQYGSQRAGQRVVQMSEGATDSKQYLIQAKQHVSVAQKMYAAVQAAPTASSYTFGGATYDKAGMIAGARRHEYEAALREQAVRLRQERAAAAKVDAREMRRTVRKKLFSRKPDGYL